MNKKLLFFLITLLFVSCGKKEEKVENAILRASLALTNGNCQEAINILELEGRQNYNDTYLKTLASGYACKAGYSTTVLYGTDIPTVSDPTLLFTEFSAFTTSPNDAVDNENYLNLQTALDIILYAGGLDSTQNPTSAKRNSAFGDKGKDINAFAFYLSLAQLGKFTYFYGNASAVTGTKGTGDPAANSCYLHYTDDIGTYLDSVDSGTCAGGADVDSGHPDLVPADETVDVKYACQGIILFNNFYDTFKNFISSTSTDLGDIASFTLDLDVIKAALIVLKNDFDTTIFDTTSQTRCESQFAGEDEDIMLFYAAIFEQLHR